MGWLWLSFRSLASLVYAAVGLLHAYAARPLVDLWDDAVLATWEESIKLVVREAFVTANRFINGASAWVLTLLDADYRESMQRAWHEQQEWHSWWREERQSTLNVVVAKCNPEGTGNEFVHGVDVTKPRLGQGGCSTGSRNPGAQQANSYSGSAAANVGTARSDTTSWYLSGLSTLWGVGKRMVKRAASKPVDSTYSPVLPSLPLPGPTVPALATSSSVTSSTGAPGQSSRQDQLSARENASSSNLASHSSSTSQSAGPDGGKTSSSSSGTRRSWFGWLWPPTTLSRAASAAVKPARHLRNSRSIIFEMPSAWGAHESLKRRGLLEDLRLLSELLVTACFEVVRMVVRWALGAPVRRSNSSSSAAASNIRAEAMRSFSQQSSRFSWLSFGRRQQQQGSPEGVRNRKKPGARAVRYMDTPVAVSATGPDRSSDNGREQQQKQSAPRQRIKLPQEKAPLQWQQHEWDDQDLSDDDKQQEQQQANQGAASSEQLRCNGKVAVTSSSSSGSGSKLGSGWLDYGKPPIGGRSRQLMRSKSAGNDLSDIYLDAASTAMPQLLLRRAHSSKGPGFSSSITSSGGSSTTTIEFDDSELSPAARLIRMAGYPLQLHTVTTEDGYLLRMERIPRLGSKKVVFFMHGILDTSLTWVSNGVTGSQAFAAWDQGVDVWLGNSRSNPPRKARDPKKQGFGYWHYSLNELGIYDWSAQIDHIHVVKCQELAAEGDPLLHPLHALDLLGTAQQAQGEAAFGSSAGRAEDQEVRNPSSSSLLSMSSKRGMSRNFSDSRLVELASLVSQSKQGLDLGLHRAPADSKAPEGEGWLAGSGSKQQQQQGQATKQRGKRDGRRSGGALANARRLWKGVLRPWSKLSQFASPAATAAATAGTAAVAAAAVTGAVAAAAAATAVATAAAAPAVAAAALSPRGRVPRKGVVKPRGSGSPVLMQSGGRFSPGKQTAVAGAGGIWGRRRSFQRAPAAAVAAAGAGSESEFWEAEDAGVTAVGSRLSLRPATAPSAVAVAAGGGEEKPTAEVAIAAAGVLPGSGAAGEAMRGLIGRRVIRAPPMQIPAPDLASSPDEPRTPEQLESPLVQCASDLLALEEAAAVAAAAAAVGVGMESNGTASGTAAAAGAEGEVVEAAAAAGVGAEEAVVGRRMGGSVSPFGDVAVQAAALEAGWGSSSSSSNSGPGNGALPAILSGVELSAGKGAVSGAAGASFGRELFPPQQQQVGRSSSSSSSSGSSAGRVGKPLARQSLPLARLDLNRRPKGGQALGSEAAQGGCSCSEQSSDQKQQQQQQRVASRERRSSFSSSRSGALGGQGCSSCRGTPPGEEPYDLKVVAHSLGGATGLIYVIMRRMAKVPHHVKRLILMSPAGYHLVVPWILWPPVLLARPLHWLLMLLFGKAATLAFFIPTLPARLLAFKLASDAARLPAFAQLIYTLMSRALGGDRSRWDRAVMMPHYCAQDMPAVSLHQGLHFVQMILRRRFELFDYGSTAINQQHYKRPTPPELGQEYWRLDIPVDLLAGKQDGVIPPDNVRHHYDQMLQQGVKVTYREFDTGHMDFTFTMKDDLQHYVMQRLLRT